MKKILLILPLLIWLGCEEESKDCFGVAGGEAIIDDCGECVDGSTGKTACIQDCNGDWGGTAFENICEYCVGGNAVLDTTYCGTVTDIDGNVYNTVIIGDQVWMAENLKVTHYRNGDAIPTGYSNSEWGNLRIGAYTIYNNNSSNEADTYGNLYNHLATYNIAPEGWHVPTDDEWTTLTDYLGGKLVAGGKMKETGTTHWNSPNTGATNESGFTAFGSGFRSYTNGSYNYLGRVTYFWASGFEHYVWRLDNDVSEVRRYVGSEYNGLSIRCVRD